MILSSINASLLVDLALPDKIVNGGVAVNINFFIDANADYFITRSDITRRLFTIGRLVFV